MNTDCKYTISQDAHRLFIDPALSHAEAIDALKKAIEQKNITSLILLSVSQTQEIFPLLLACISHCPLEYLDLTNSAFTEKQRYAINNALLKNPSVFSVKGIPVNTLVEKHLQANQKFFEIKLLIEKYEALPIPSEIKEIFKPVTQVTHLLEAAKKCYLSRKTDNRAKKIQDALELTVSQPVLDEDPYYSPPSP
jgi:hypothetical protein